MICYINCEEINLFYESHRDKRYHLIKRNDTYYRLVVES
ncbi:MAG: hypothetical protein KatS3mg003_2359 [Candidatus Nitrosocaldaceae archaeon]|nr:MAG: hypothetical protein KatS3mg003_0954 [Candidatus Nitrosocaldaceae archaeon]GIU72880.1 MAG: hypothetical protein KatS3mg003_2359 [Candidatus Nitrosocaldaceae archaeon]